MSDATESNEAAAHETQGTPVSKSPPRPTKRKSMRNKIGKQLTLRERGFIRAVQSGAKTFEEAALEAGYSPVTAKTCGNEIAARPLVKHELDKAFRSKGIGPSRVVELFGDGLKANVVHLGEQTDVPDLGERRRWVELLLKVTHILAPANANITFAQFNGRMEDIPSSQLISMASASLQRLQHLKRDLERAGVSDEDLQTIDAEFTDGQPGEVDGTRAVG